MQGDRKRRVRIAPNLYQRPSDGKFEIGFSDSRGRWRIRTLRARTNRGSRGTRPLHDEAAGWASRGTLEDHVRRGRGSVRRRSRSDGHRRRPRSSYDRALQAASRRSCSSRHWAHAGAEAHRGRARGLSSRSSGRGSFFMDSEGHAHADQQSAVPRGSPRLRVREPSASPPARGAPKGQVEGRSSGHQSRRNRKLACCDGRPVPPGARGSCLRRAAGHGAARASVVLHRSRKRRHSRTSSTDAGHEELSRNACRAEDACSRPRRRSLS